MGSFSTSERMRVARQLLYRNVSTGAEHRISQLFTFGSGDLRDRDRKGILFAHALPPGEYEFYNYLVHNDNAIVQQSWFAEDDFSVLFTVSPASLTYMGDIQFNPLTANNIVGISVPAGGAFKIVDNRDRDLSQLRARNPDLEWSKIAHGPLFGQTLPPPVAADVSTE